MTIFNIFLFFEVFIATNASGSWYEFGETHNAIVSMLEEINAADKINLISEKTQFAVENDGFRFALAKCLGFKVDKHYNRAKESWSETRSSIQTLIKILLILKPQKTHIFADLRHSYNAVSNLCKEMNFEMNIDKNHKTLNGHCEKKTIYFFYANVHSTLCNFSIRLLFENLKNIKFHL